MDTKYATSKFHGREVRAKFYDMAKELGDLGAWVRMHYVYPYPHVDDVIPLMAEGKILPYLDIPFQHAAPNVSEGDAAAGEPGKGAGPFGLVAENLSRTLPSAPPSSWVFPARLRRISLTFWTG